MQARPSHPRMTIAPDARSCAFLRSILKTNSYVDNFRRLRVRVLLFQFLLLFHVFLFFKKKSFVFQSAAGLTKEPIKNLSRLTICTHAFAIIGLSPC